MLWHIKYAFWCPYMQITKGMWQDLQDVTDDNTRTITVLYTSWHNLGSIHTWVMRNLVSLSGSLPFSLERIISSMSPWSFSITTNTFSGVSNMHSKFTMPRWRKLWDKDQRGGRGVGEREHQEWYENCFKKKGWMKNVKEKRVGKEK